MARRQLTGGLVHTPFLQGLSNLLSEPWRKFLAQATDQSNEAPSIATVTLEAQTAAISVTPMPTDQLPAGLYRVTAYLKIRTPASVTSSVQVTVTATDGVDVCPRVGTALTGNTVTSANSTTFLVRTAAGTPISYSVAYASNAAGMAYDAELVLEQMG